MNKKEQRLNTVYSGWHHHANEGATEGGGAGGQTDLVAEIERLKAELAEAKAAPKKGKAKLEVVE